MLNALKDNRLVPVLRKIRFDDSTYIIDSLVTGGVRIVEITLDTERALDIISNTIDKIENFYVGAGTVLSLDDCHNAIAAGAQFIVSPVLNEEVVAYAVEQQVPVIPGVYSPTEMMRAYELGATAVKLFPASSVGPEFVRDIQGPMGHIPILVTGGIDLGNARSYLDAGAIAVGAGSALLRKDLIAAGNWTGIVEEVQEWFKVLRA